MHERDRNYCFLLLNEYTKSESLLKHALAVEACVLEYSRILNGDSEYWGNVALLHDFDYEMFPSETDHPYKGAEILRERGFEEEFIQTILSHTNYTGVPRTTQLRKVLFACDELAGFLTAVSYVRPTKNLDGVEPKSVIKKMKDKAFARSVSREDMIKGAELLGLPLEEHIMNCINGMRKVSETLFGNK